MLRLARVLGVGVVISALGQVSGGEPERHERIECQLIEGNVKRLNERRRPTHLRFRRLTLDANDCLKLENEIFAAV